MNPWIRTLEITGLFAVSLFLAPRTSSPAQAQVLDDFEQDATQQRDSASATPREGRRRSSGDTFYHHAHHDAGSEENLASALLLGLGTGFVAGGINSWCRINPPTDTGSEEDGSARRPPGDPLIPFVRLDGSYQYLDSDMDAWDYRIQGGYGPIALEYGNARYREKAPEDYMNVRRAAVLYRMSASHLLEIDIGLGAVELDGNSKHRAFCFSLPVLFYPKEYLGVEFRPYWARFNGSRFNEYDVAACVTLYGLGLKAGYRWLVTPDSSLHGPYTGLVFRF